MIYYSPVWRPHLIKEIKGIETVQRSALPDSYLITTIGGLAIKTD